MRFEDCDYVRLAPRIQHSGLALRVIGLPVYICYWMQSIIILPISYVQIAWVLLCNSRQTWTNQLTVKNTSDSCKEPVVGSQHPYNSLQSLSTLVSGDLRTLLIPIGTRYIHAVHTYMHMHTHINMNESFLEEQMSLSQSFQLDYEYGNIGFSPIKN